MKRGTIKRIAAGVLAAAMVLTLSPTVTANAKKKKEATFVVDKGFAQGKYASDNSVITVGTNYVGGFINIENAKKKAKYTFTTNSKSVTVKYNDGNVTIKAKKKGTFKITAKEKLNGKTRKLGTKSIKVFAPTLRSSTFTGYAGSYVSAYAYLKIAGNWNATITDDPDGVLDYESSDDGDSYGSLLHLVKAGTGKITISDDYGKNKQTLTVTVKPDNITGIIAATDEYDDEDLSSIQADLYEKTTDEDGYTSDNAVSMSKYFLIKTEQYPDGTDDYDDGDVTIESENPAVFSVEKSTDPEYGVGSWIGKGLSAGTTNVTVKAGDYSLTIPVTVYSNSCTNVISSNGLDSDAEDVDYSKISSYIVYSDDDYDYSDNLKYYYAICTDKYPNGTYDDDGDTYVNRTSAEEVTITSADPSVYEVRKVTDDDGYVNWYGYGRKAGETTVTVTCNGHSLDIPVTVSDDDD